MHGIAQLWLPILVTAVLVFIASSLIHMVFKWHNSDYKRLANEDEVLAVLRAGSADPGQYVFPYCADMKKMREEEMLQKYRQGPVGFLTLVKCGTPNIATALLKWFAFSVLVAAFAGCIARQATGVLAEGYPAGHLGGHLVGMISLAAYAGGSVQQGIWMGKPWRSVAKDLLDALIYATISALVFMWLWP